MSGYYLQSVIHKIGIAKKLNAGEIGGSYSEALLIISSILSATASIIWPGDRIDRRRFVELLVTHNTTDYNLSKVSIPLLSKSNILTKEQENIIFEEYRKKSHSIIITGEDIDMDEHIVTTLCPDIELKIIREFSYANIFYKELRSSIVHEYHVSDYASDYPQTKRNTFVSYNNHLEYPFRRICFHFNPLKVVTESIAYNVAELVEQIRNSSPEETSRAWWLDGAELVI